MHKDERESHLNRVYCQSCDGGPVKVYTGTHHNFVDTDYFVHVTEITNLCPATTYRFGFHKDHLNFKFKTIPRDTKEAIRFVVGGDTYFSKELLKAGNLLAAKQNPMFVVIGGDIAYSVSKYSLGNDTEDLQRWFDWLERWKEDMVGLNGNLIPLIVAIGNHEVEGKYNQSPKEARGFYDLFSMPGKRGYNVLDFNNFLTILLLDSGHTNPIEGDQAEWIAKTLDARRHFYHRFAVYHVAAYPSVRPFSYKRSKYVRQHWPAIFEQHGLSVAFEHHDHAYKRTHLLRGDKIDPKGVLYMGDGAWGVNARQVKSPKDCWYLAKSASVNHVICVDLKGKERYFTVFDTKERVVDSYFDNRP